MIELNKLSFLAPFATPSTQRKVVNDEVLFKKPQKPHDLPMTNDSNQIKSLSLGQMIAKSTSLRLIKQSNIEAHIQKLIPSNQLLQKNNGPLNPQEQQVMMTLCQTPKSLELARNAGLKNIIVLEKLSSQMKSLDFEGFDNVLASKNFSWTLSDILPEFEHQTSWFSSADRIHPTAVIDPSVTLGSNVSIGAYTIIGKNSHIGDHCKIGPHCILEDGVQVGAMTTLVSQVRIGSFSKIGEHCLLHPFVSLGTDGFGFFTSPSGQHRKVPQVGNVILEDHVELQTFVVVDRSTLGTTRIGKGTKIDNHAHIAHNCEIGENGLIAGGFFLAGSSKIGRQFMCGGTTIISDHVEITDHVMLAGRSTVVKDISQQGAYGGFPLQPLREYLKNLANIAELTTMRKQIAQMMKHLGLSPNTSVDLNDKGDAHGS
jgi:UDP-3-O-[3-hydroxymyristoyl] glucosamine N-acyltransferase